MKNKTARLDARIPEELRALVDQFAIVSRMSRSQVIERALLAYFGQAAPATPQAVSINEASATFPDPLRTGKIAPAA